MKRTYQPSVLKKIRRHGFFARKRAGTGILQSRRSKGRKALCASR